MARIERLLIANRGEIACRIIRTARRLGIATIAVYSDADRASRHVALADEAVHIGPAPALQSYLSMDAALEAARRSRADAVHPGYGFLSENAAFAAACAQASLIWVGPPAAAIEAMGSKSAAKEMMSRAGVPVLPGYHGPEQSNDALISAADRVGYPVILKAVAGGGGKGMQIVADRSAMPAALESARRIARSAFRSDALLLERYLAEPRHVEVQVFADRHGSAAHLLDRDCSVQRRHQKVIEEAPAPGVPEAVRAAMGEAAVRAARAVRYVGAGTVEFLLDPQGGFYFMEMNTRLQVEHPVTEAVTGLDLVEWQLRIAAGESLPSAMSDVKAMGHAIEARVYAEDPSRDYLPSVGRIERLRWPEPGEGLRIDTGVAEGDEISSHYDPMIAKVIAHAPTREAAIERLRIALAQLQVAGVTCNAAFVGRILGSRSFREGPLSTRLLERESGIERTLPSTRASLRRAAALWISAATKAAGASPWACGDSFRLNLPSSRTVWLLDSGTRVHLVLTPLDGNRYRIVEASDERMVSFVLSGDSGLRIEEDGRSFAFEVFEQGERIHIWGLGEDASFELADPEGAEPADASRDGGLSTPLPGTVVAIEVKAGDRVKAGQVLLVVEAMKMEHSIRAPRAGVVGAIRCRVGERVAEGVPLAEITDS